MSGQKSIEIVEGMKEILSGYINDIGTYSLPAEIEYDKKCNKATLKTGWNRVDERYHVYRFFDIAPHVWTEMLSKI